MVYGIVTHSGSQPEGVKMGCCKAIGRSGDWGKLETLESSSYLALITYYHLEM